MNISPAEYYSLLRLDFRTFLQRCFHLLNADTPFFPNWHIDLLAEKLDACRRGEIKRLIINVPPRSLKSIATSVALPAFWLGHRPQDRIICVSYAQDLSDKLARDCRTVMTSPMYQRLFGRVLSSGRTAVGELDTCKQGGRMATSVGGVLTGRGADVIILDDPLKPDEAVSDTLRSKVNHWYDRTLISRLNNKSTGCIIIVMQRLHEDDLVGHVLKQEGWEMVSLPAIAEVDQSFGIITPFGSMVAGRKEGEALHPARESLETLSHLRRTMTEDNFAAQYQQNPIPPGGGMIKLAWFKRYEERDRPEQFDRVVQCWDTANKANELADYSVCCTLGVKNKQIYLLHVYRARLEYPDLKREVISRQKAFQAREVVIEDKASGTQLIQELKREGFYYVREYKPKDEKVMRMNRQTATIANGFVHIPKEAAWLDDFLHELCVFPRGKHDDQVDSLSQALDYLTAGRQPMRVSAEAVALAGRRPQAVGPSFVLTPSGHWMLG